MHKAIPGVREAYQSIHAQIPMIEKKRPSWKLNHTFEEFEDPATREKNMRYQEVSQYYSEIEGCAARIAAKLREIDNIDLNQAKDDDVEVSNQKRFVDDQIMRAQAALPTEYYMRMLNTKDVNQEIISVDERITFNAKNYKTSLLDIGVKEIDMDEPKPAEEVAAGGKGKKGKAAAVPAAPKKKVPIGVPKRQTRSNSMVEENNDISMAEMDRMNEDVYLLMQQAFSFKDKSTALDINARCQKFRDSCVKHTQSMISKQKSEIRDTVAEKEKVLRSLEAQLPVVRAQNEEADALIAKKNNSDFEVRQIVEEHYRDTMTQLTDHSTQQYDQIQTKNEALRDVSHKLTKYRLMFEELAAKRSRADPFMRRRAQNLVRGLLANLDEKDQQLQEEREEKVADNYRQWKEVREMTAHSERRQKALETQCSTTVAEIYSQKCRIEMEKVSYRDRARQAKHTEEETAEMIRRLEKIIADKAREEKRGEMLNRKAGHSGSQDYREEEEIIGADPDSVAVGEMRGDQLTSTQLYIKSMERKYKAEIREVTGEPEPRKKSVAERKASKTAAQFRRLMSADLRGLDAPSGVAAAASKSIDFAESDDSEGGGSSGDESASLASAAQSVSLKVPSGGGSSSSAAGSPTSKTVRAPSMTVKVKARRTSIAKVRNLLDDHTESILDVSSNQSRRQEMTKTKLAVTSSPLYHTAPALGKSFNAASSLQRDGIAAVTAEISASLNSGSQPGTPDAGQSPQTGRKELSSPQPVPRLPYAGASSIDRVPEHEVLAGTSRMGSAGGHHEGKAVPVHSVICAACYVDCYQRESSNPAAGDPKQRPRGLTHLASFEIPGMEPQAQAVQPSSRRNSSVMKQFGGSHYTTNLIRKYCATQSTVSEGVRVLATIINALYSTECIGKERYSAVLRDLDNILSAEKLCSTSAEEDEVRYKLHICCVCVVHEVMAAAPKVLLVRNDRSQFMEVLTNLLGVVGVILNCSLFHWKPTAGRNGIGSEKIELVAAQIVELVVANGNLDVKSTVKRKLPQLTLTDAPAGKEAKLDPTKFIDGLRGLLDVLLSSVGAENKLVTHPLLKVISARIDKLLAAADKGRRESTSAAPDHKECPFTAAHRHALYGVQLCLYTTLNDKEFTSAEVADMFDKAIADGDRLGQVKDRVLESAPVIPTNFDDLLLQVNPQIVPALFALELLRTVIEEEFSRVKFVERIARVEDSVAELQFLNVTHSAALDVAIRQSAGRAAESRVNSVVLPTAATAASLMADAVVATSRPASVGLSRPVSVGPATPLLTPPGTAAALVPSAAPTTAPATAAPTAQATSDAPRPPTAAGPEQTTSLPVATIAPFSAQPTSDSSAPTAPVAPPPPLLGTASYDAQAAALQTFSSQAQAAKTHHKGSVSHQRTLSVSSQHGDGDRSPHKLSVSHIKLSLAPTAPKDGKRSRARSSVSNARKLSNMTAVPLSVEVEDNTTSSAEVVVPNNYTDFNAVIRPFVPVMNPHAGARATFAPKATSDFTAASDLPANRPREPRRGSASPTRASSPLAADAGSNNTSVRSAHQEWLRDVESHVINLGRQIHSLVWHPALTPLVMAMSPTKAVIPVNEGEEDKARAAQIPLPDGVVYKILNFVDALQKILNGHYLDGLQRVEALTPAYLDCIEEIRVSRGKILRIVSALSWPMKKRLDWLKQKLSAALLETSEANRQIEEKSEAIDVLKREIEKYRLSHAAVEREKTMGLYKKSRQITLMNHSPDVQKMILEHATKENYAQLQECKAMERLLEESLVQFDVDHNSLKVHFGRLQVAHKSMGGASAAQQAQLSALQALADDASLDLEEHESPITITLPAAHPHTPSTAVSSTASAAPTVPQSPLDSYLTMQRLSDLLSAMSTDYEESGLKIADTAALNETLKSIQRSKAAAAMSKDAEAQLRYMIRLSEQDGPHAPVPARRYPPKPNAVIVTPKVFGFANRIESGLRPLDGVDATIAAGAETAGGSGESAARLGPIAEEELESLSEKMLNGDYAEVVALTEGGSRPNTAGATAVRKVKRVALGAAIAAGMVKKAEDAGKPVGAFVPVPARTAKAESAADRSFMYYAGKGDFRMSPEGKHASPLAVDEGGSDDPLADLLIQGNVPPEQPPLPHQHSQPRSHVPHLEPHTQHKENVFLRDLKRPTPFRQAQLYPPASQDLLHPLDLMKIMNVQLKDEEAAAAHRPRRQSLKESLFEKYRHFNDELLDEELAAAGGVDAPVSAANSSEAMQIMGRYKAGEEPSESADTSLVAEGEDGFDDRLLELQQAEQSAREEELASLAAIQEVHGRSASTTAALGAASKAVAAGSILLARKKSTKFDPYRFSRSAKQRRLVVGDASAGPAKSRQATRVGELAAAHWEDIDLFKVDEEESFLHHNFTFVDDAKSTLKPKTLVSDAAGQRHEVNAEFTVLDSEPEPETTRKQSVIMQSVTLNSKIKELLQSEVVVVMEEVPFQSESARDAAAGISAVPPPEGAKAGAFPRKASYVPSSNV